MTRSLYQSGFLLDQDLFIGSRNWTTPDLALPGIIDQIIIANRAWNKDEVTRFYNKPWFGMIKYDLRRFSQFSNLDWTPTDPMGLLGIHGI